MRDAGPAVKAQKKLEKEFEKRDRELQDASKQLRSLQDTLEKNGVTMAESDRRAKEREFNDLNREFQRKQREFREDLNQRRNEELASVLSAPTRRSSRSRERELRHHLPGGGYANPRIDITDKVLKALADNGKAADGK